MAFQATVPMVIMAGALTVLGTFTGSVYNKRQIHEHSQAWETGLVRVLGVIPPRTRIDPYIAKPHPALAGREIPLYTAGPLLSQIVPGGPLDPYANPKPTPAAIEKEKARILALGAIDAEDIAVLEAEHKENLKYIAQREKADQFKFRNVYRSDPRAEYFRIQAYQKLHPELTLDEAKFKEAEARFNKVKYYY